MDPNVPPSSPESSPASTSPGTSQIFVNTDATKADPSTENVFNYMTDGKEFSRAPKPKVGLLDTIEKWGRWVTLLVVLIVMFTYTDSWFRLQDDNSTSPLKYSFLCDYLTKDVEGYNNKNCITPFMIKKEMDEKKRVLEDKIIEGLAEYLPLKIQQGSLFAPEEAFIADVIKERVPLIDVMSDFNNAELSANSGATNPPVLCEGVQITSKGLFNTKCRIYGGPIGDIGDTGRRGSSRVEAMKFIDLLRPTETHFIVTIPPSSLSIDLLRDKDKEKPELADFTTTTFIPLQLQYVSPFEKAPRI